MLFIAGLFLLFISTLLLLPGYSNGESSVARSGRESEILSAITDYARNKAGDVELRVRRATLGAADTLPPDGQLDYEIVAPPQWEGWGSAAIAVIVRQGNRLVANMKVNVEIEAFAEMVFAKQVIQSGSIISSDDLMLRSYDIAAVQGRYLSRIDDVAGKKARYAIRANLPVKPEYVEKIPLIKTGQMVTIVIENRNMRITATGKARGSGSKGDVINVQNLSSMKNIPAVVKDSSTVVVAF